MFNDAQDMLKKLVDKKLLKARAVVGLYPAQSVGDDIHVYADDKAAREGNAEAVFYGLRQQVTTSRTSNSSKFPFFFFVYLCVFLQLKNALLK